MTAASISSISAIRIVSRSLNSLILLAETPVWPKRRLWPKDAMPESRAGGAQSVNFMKATSRQLSERPDKMARCARPRDSSDDRCFSFVSSSMPVALDAVLPSYEVAPATRICCRGGHIRCDAGVSLAFLIARRKRNSRFASSRLLFFFSGAADVLTTQTAVLQLCRRALVDSADCLGGFALVGNLMGID